MPRRPFPGSSRPRASPSRSAQTMSRLAASLLVVLVLAALATVLGEEVLLDGLHRVRDVWDLVYLYKACFGYYGFA